MVVALDVIVVFAFCLMSLKNELNESASFVEDCVYSMRGWKAI